MSIRLTDEALRYIALFEDITGVTPIDCVAHEDELTLIVPPDAMAQAIGPDGETVRSAESRIGKQIVIIEDAADPDVFVANALAPAAIYDVSIEEADGERTAHALVDERDMGVAIGANGSRIERAKRLAKRHFDIHTIELESVDPAKDVLK